MVNLMQCPKCRADNRDGVRFCEECGAMLEIRCPACNALIPPGKKFCGECGADLAQPAPLESSVAPSSPPELPSSFLDGRYQVKEFLGKGGKKKVYRTYDTLLDRDVALALIKLEGLDEDSRTRITREAQAMVRLGPEPISEDLLPGPFRPGIRGKREHLGPDTPLCGHRSARG